MCTKLMMLGGIKLSDCEHRDGGCIPLSHSQEMLYRRLQKLQQLVTATNQLDKAKPQKKEEVSVAICS